MLEADLITLIQKIQHKQCNFQTIEVIAANTNTPRLYETLSSFSNQDNGGIIVLGLNETDNYKVCGVFNLEKLKHDIVCACQQMEPSLSPLFTETTIDEKFILCVEIPGIDVYSRPVFYKGSGRSYVRVDGKNEPMCDYEIYSYKAFKHRIRDDLRPVNNANLSLFDKDLLNKFLNQVKKDKTILQNNFSDDEILELFGITVNSVPTLSGVLTFSKYPQAYYPQLSIVAAVIPGTRIGELGPNNERFISSKRFTGNIIQQLESALCFLSRNMKDRIVI